MARVLIGTSGWHYDSWRGPFFPKGLPLQNQLQNYASQLPTTELNGVFYRTPTPEAVTNWRDQSGNDFVFAWKASKFITHWKRLSDNSVNSLELLEDRLSLLGDKAGPVLFQLPPQFSVNADRMASFFKNISLCISDHHDAPAPWKRTADFVYVRGHGPGGRYKGHYRPGTLANWSRRIRSWKKQGYDVYVYFDNDQKSAAPADALKLRLLLE